MRLAPILAAGALLLAAAPAAQAFGTINGLGQNAEHEKITRLALRCGGSLSDRDCFGPRTLDVLAGKRGTFGMVGGPDSGSLLLQSSAHCDNGDWLDVPGYPQTREKAQAALEACRDWMRTSIETAATRAGDVLDEAGALRPRQVGGDCARFGGDQPSAKCKALEAFGATLHAAQDFYAHSNWVDRPNPGPTGPDNPPGLGHDGPAPWLDWRTGAAFPAGLISDCFGGSPERLFCNYANTFRAKHAFINKDTGSIDPVREHTGAGTSPRGMINGNFQRAVAAARDETRVKWATLKGLLVERYGAERGARIACVLRNDDPAKACR
ncbi:MAG: hypothetical protein KAX56_12750 [Phenylobacterium sp.]|nr:hypothetical protein [Phenylobacterium sp.]